MKILIVEDDFGSRKIMQNYLAPYGDCDVVVDGQEAVDAFRCALEEEEPYHLICLDIMLPKMDGQKVLKQIRELETESGIFGSSAVKVIMTTALGDVANVMEAFKFQCEGYIQKPIERDKLLQELKNIGIL